MKKTLLLLTILILSQRAVAQSYQIMNSASGTMETFTALVQDKEIYGYIEVRKMDLEDKLTETHKYIVLDKNMNKVCSGDFKNDLIKKRCYTDLYDITYCNGKIIFCYTQYIFNGSGNLPLVCSYKILDIVSNKIVAENNFEKDIDLTQNPPKLYKQFKRFYTYPLLANSGFLIKRSEFDSGEWNSDFYAITAKGDEDWQQETEDVEKKEKMQYQLIESDKDYIIFMATISKHDKKISDNLLILDAKTGKKVAFTELFNDDYTLKYLDISIKNGKLNMVGRYFEKDKRDNVDFDESLGLYRRIVDLKSGKIDSDVFLPFGKFNSLDIDENGRVRKEGYLYFQTVDLNPDGTYFALAETSKKGKYFNELYVFLMDKDFKPMKVEKFDVKKTRGDKYSFSQDLPNKVGKAYFFYDKTEEKDYELNVLNFIYGSNSFTTTKMDLKNEKSSIRVMPAKTGFVSIVEYFKDPKKEGKSMEIRLEKLNYERQ
jgi:hypothetical protein